MSRVAVSYTHLDVYKRQLYQLSLLNMVSLGGKAIDIAAFEQIVLQTKEVNLAAPAVKEVTRSYDFLRTFSKDKLIYGINTGFGPMAQYRINDTDRKQLQYNLIRSHSSGMGQLLSPLHSRAMLLARLHTMLLGFSGIHPDTVQLMTDLLNNEAYPCVYAHGGVGASGDLVQLSLITHLDVYKRQVVYRHSP